LLLVKVVLAALLFQQTTRMAITDLLVRNQRLDRT
jgi:hypothetical protein